MLALAFNSRYCAQVRPHRVNLFHSSLKLLSKMWKTKKLHLKKLISLPPPLSSVFNMKNTHICRCNDLRCEKRSKQQTLLKTIRNIFIQAWYLKKCRSEQEGNKVVPIIRKPLGDIIVWTNILEKNKLRYCLGLVYLLARVIDGHAVANPPQWDR